MDLIKPFFFSVSNPHTPAGSRSVGEQRQPNGSISMRKTILFLAVIFCLLMVSQALALNPMMLQKAGGGKSEPAAEGAAWELAG